MKNVRVKATQATRTGEPFGCVFRASDEETGIEYILEVTVLGDGEVWIKHGPYNGRKTDTNLGGLMRESEEQAPPLEAYEVKVLMEKGKLKRVEK
jgi:hypothetical protein